MPKVKMKSSNYLAQVFGFSPRTSSLCPSLHFLKIIFMPILRSLVNHISDREKEVQENLKGLSGTLKGNTKEVDV